MSCPAKTLLSLSLSVSLSLSLELLLPWRSRRRQRVDALAAWSAIPVLEDGLPVAITAREVRRGDGRLVLAL